MKTTLNDKGVFIEQGAGVVLAGAVTLESTLSVASFPTTTVLAKTAAATLTAPGVYTVSGSAALALTMPLASAVPGGIFTLRALSNHAHHMTGSAEASGTKVFKSIVTGSEMQAEGSDIAVAAGVGNSVTIFSDGANFCVLTASGSVTISGL